MTDQPRDPRTPPPEGDGGADARSGPTAPGAGHDARATDPLAARVDDLLAEEGVGDPALAALLTDATQTLHAAPDEVTARRHLRAMRRAAGPSTVVVALRRGAVAGTAAAGIVVALAVGGLLPDGAQRVASETAARVGIQLPSPDDDASDEASDDADDGDQSTGGDDAARTDTGRVGEDHEPAGPPDEPDDDEARGDRAPDRPGADPSDGARPEIELPDLETPDVGPPDRPPRRGRGSTPPSVGEDGRGAGGERPQPPTPPTPGDEPRPSPPPATDPGDADDRAPAAPDRGEQVGDDASSDGASALERDDRPSRSDERTMRDRDGADAAPSHEWSETGADAPGPDDRASRGGR